MEARVKILILSKIRTCDLRTKIYQTTTSTPLGGRGVPLGYSNKIAELGSFRQETRRDGKMRCLVTAKELGWQQRLLLAVSIALVRYSTVL